MATTTCNLCSKEYYIRPSSLLKNKHNFCSRECCVKSLPIMVYSKERNLKISKSKKGTCFSEKHKTNLSLALKGKMPSNIDTLKASEGWKSAILKTKGLPIPTQRRFKISKTMKAKKNHLWKGGISSINQLIRKSLEYKLWRESVFARDNFTCVFCNARGVKLNADHIKPFSSHTNLRFELSIGRTLCEPCHRSTDTYGSKFFIKIKNEAYAN